MSIVASEIKRYKSVVVSDGSTNGGRMSAVESVSNTSQNVWPAAYSAELTAGSTKYRKLYHKVANDDDLTLSSTQIYLSAPTSGDDEVYLFEGTQTDTQADISGPDLYGAGLLDGAVTAGATTISVAVADGAVTIFRDADTIRLCETSGTSSTAEFATVSGAPTVVADVVSLDLASGLSNGYSTAASCASVIDAGDIECSVSAATVTSASGTFDTTEISVDNIGGVYDTFTFTFTSATDFGCVGAAEGSLGSGAIGSSFAPNNSDFTKPFFTVATGAWGGTFASNDTVAVTLSPAAAPIWEKRVIPAGAASLAGNSRTVYVDGESA